MTLESLQKINGYQQTDPLAVQDSFTQPVTTEDMKSKTETHLVQDIQSIRTLWIKEVKELHDKQDVMKATITELEARVHNKSLAKEDRQHVGDDWLEERLYQQRQEIWRLTQCIHNIEQASNFACHDGPDESGVRKNLIDKALESIQFELGSLMCGHRLVAPKIERQSELGSLLRSVLGIEKDAMHREALKAFLARFDAEYVMRAFFVAALRDWVFETAFPTVLPSNDRSLNTYRQVVFDFGMHSIQ